MNVKASKKTITQFSTLFLSNYSLVILSFATSILMTHAMLESEYGYYKYAMSIITMCVALIDGGIHYSAARLIAISDKSKENAIFSTTVVIMVVFSVIFTILANSILVIVNKFFINIDVVAFWSVSLVFTIMLQRMFITVLTGNNRINDIIIQTVLPQIIMLVIYLVLKVLNYRIDFQVSLLIYGTVYIIVHLFTWLRLKLKFPFSFIGNLKEIVKENKINGFQLYKGSVASVFVGEVLTVIVGANVEKSIFGMYALALSISAPISTIPRVMSTIKYRDNANNLKLSNKNIIATLLVSLLGLISLNVGAKILFPVFFESRYDGALGFLFICSFTFLVHGLGDYFNQFSASHGLGSKLKNGAYLSGSAQVISAVSLVPIYGIAGLIVAKLISSTIYCGNMIYIYLQYIKSSSSNEREN